MKMHFVNQSILLPVHSLEAFLTPESGGVEAGVSRARVGLEAKGRNQQT